MSTTSGSASPATVTASAPSLAAPDQVDVVLLLEDDLQAAPEQGMIVGDQHPDRLGAFTAVRSLRGSHRCVAASAQFVASLGNGPRQEKTLADPRPRCKPGPARIMAGRRRADYSSTSRITP